MELTKLGLEQEIRQFMEDADKIYKQTGMPLLPCAITHLCIPFGFFCAGCYCYRQRQSRLKDLVKAFNNETLDKGFFLGFGCPNRYAGYALDLVPLEVRMDLPKRKKYCAMRYIDFVMPKTLPEPTVKAARCRTKRCHESSGFDSGCNDGGGWCGDGCC